MRLSGGILCDERRKDDRFIVQLRCRMQTSEFELPATVVNLSLGGVGVVIMPGLPRFALSQIRCVVIDPIGTFDVICRWKSGPRIGAAFKYRDRSRLRVAAYLDTLSPPPQPVQPNRPG